MGEFTKALREGLEAAPGRDSRLPENEKTTKEQAKEKPLIYRLLVDTRWRGLVILAIFFIWLAAIAGSVYFFWFYLIPVVWRWGFDPLSWISIISVILAFFILSLPFIPMTVGWDYVKPLVYAYADERDAEVKRKVKELNREREAAEKKLEAEDKTGLIPLIQYSRIQLEKYYTIGLSQTQRSFRYSVLAMWIGFIVIIGGLGLYLSPLVKAETNTALKDIHIITIAGGVVIEIISALFLWIYRSSINQLNYFYNRQMHIHNVLLCDRIATSMAKPDETKRIIVEKVLGSTWEVKPLDAPGKGLSTLLKASE
jgi:hypothetical protein